MISISHPFRDKASRPSIINVDPSARPRTITTFQVFSHWSNLSRVTGGLRGGRLTVSDTKECFGITSRFAQIFNIASATSRLDSLLLTTMFRMRSSPNHILAPAPRVSSIRLITKTGTSAMPSTLIVRLNTSTCSGASGVGDGTISSESKMDTGRSDCSSDTEKSALMVSWICRFNQSGPLPPSLYWGTQPVSLTLVGALTTESTNLDTFRPCVRATIRSQHSFTADSWPDIRTASRLKTTEQIHGFLLRK